MTNASLSFDLPAVYALWTLFGFCFLICLYWILKPAFRAIHPKRRLLLQTFGFYWMLAAQWCALLVLPIILWVEATARGAVLVGALTAAFMALRATVRSQGPQGSLYEKRVQRDEARRRLREENLLQVVWWVAKLIMIAFWLFRDSIVEHFPRWGRRTS